MRDKPYLQRQLGYNIQCASILLGLGKDSLLLKETEVKQGIEQTSPTHMFISVKGSKATIFESEILHMQEAVPVIEYV